MTQFETKNCHLDMDNSHIWVHHWGFSRNRILAPNPQLTHKPALPQPSPSQLLTRLTLHPQNSSIRPAAHAKTLSIPWVASLGYTSCSTSCPQRPLSKKALNLPSAPLQPQSRLPPFSPGSLVLVPSLPRHLPAPRTGSRGMSATLSC